MKICLSILVSLGAGYLSSASGRSTWALFLGRESTLCNWVIRGENSLHILYMFLERQSMSRLSQFYSFIFAMYITPIRKLLKKYC